MKICYARVSTKDQNPNLQIDALKAVGCEKVYVEFISGGRAERPVLNDMLNNLRQGDILVVWKLDRLGRSLKHLVELTNQLMARIGLQSLNDPIDTATLCTKALKSRWGPVSMVSKDEQDSSVSLAAFP